jgi:hypothetical protein
MRVSRHLLRSVSVGPRRIGQAVRVNPQPGTRQRGWLTLAIVATLMSLGAIFDAVWRYSRVTQ